MSCWAFGDVLSKCSPTRKSQTAEVVKVKAWVGNNKDEEVCMLKNVSWGCCGVLKPFANPHNPESYNYFRAEDLNKNPTLKHSCFFGTFWACRINNPYKDKFDNIKAGDCREHEASFDQCKSFLGFGMSVLAGQTDQKVIFGSNCYWKPSTRPQFGDLGDNNFLWYNNVNHVGINNTWINTPGYHYAPDRKPVQFSTDSKVIWERRTSDGSSRFVVDVDRPKTCPNLGKKPPVINDSSCGLSGIAECTYDMDAIAGSCTDRECVKSSLDTFITQARTMLKPNPQAAKSALVEWYEMDKEPDYTVLEKAQMINRNRGLAFLVQGAAEVGKCGEVGRSCMAKLNTADCATISRFATEVQQESGTLYSALKRLSNVCYAEAV